MIGKNSPKSWQDLTESQKNAVNAALDRQEKGDLTMKLEGLLKDLQDHKTEQEKDFQKLESDLKLILQKISEILNQDKAEGASASPILSKLEELETRIEKLEQRR